MGLRGIPNRWTEALDVVGSLGIALGELSVAVLLAWPRARWLGLWTATIMHVALLAALGPFGLNHSLGVLLWNVFFIVQNWLLFREAATSHPPSGETVLVQIRLWLRDLVTWPTSRPNRLALGVITAAMVWPVTEPFGYCDHWQAWAVYSARADAVGVLLVENLSAENFHLSVQRHIVVQQWGRQSLEMQRWSLDVLDAPIPSQNRFHLGVCLALQHGFDGEELFELDLWGPPNVGYPQQWYPRGRYPEIDAAGYYISLAKLDEGVGHFRWNARPRMRTFAARMQNPSP